MPCGMKQKKTGSNEPVVRHKRLELSLLSEPDPKSGASTNSANAARVRQQDRDVDTAPLNQRDDLCLRSHIHKRYAGLCLCFTDKNANEMRFYRRGDFAKTT